MIEVVITVKGEKSIEEQLDRCGIKYTHYGTDKYAYYSTNDLVINLYDKLGGFWNNTEDQIKLQIATVNKLIDESFGLAVQRQSIRFNVTDVVSAWQT